MTCPDQLLTLCYFASIDVIKIFATIKLDVKNENTAKTTTTGD